MTPLTSLLYAISRLIQVEAMPHRNLLPRWWLINVAGHVEISLGKCRGTIEMAFKHAVIMGRECQQCEPLENVYASTGEREAWARNENRINALLYHRHESTQSAGIPWFGHFRTV